MIDERLLGGNTYLFRAVADRVAAYRNEHPDVELLQMGVGDVKMPIAPFVARAIMQAAGDMSTSDGFRGYPPTEGYDFARRAIYDSYREMGIDVGLFDCFVGSGAKDELAIWSRVFDANYTALVPTPAYPVYLDVCRAVGRQAHMIAAETADRLPMPTADLHDRYLIFLCSPNNPIGLCYSMEELHEWVRFALETRSVILFDAAYAAFVHPYSIFAVEGAEKACIEIGTLSKSASFSGMRFGWSAVGVEVLEGAAKHAYLHYKSIATNGVAYVVQRAGEAALHGEGQKYSRALIEQYKYSAQYVGKALQDAGYECNIGPYIWLKMPHCTGSAFDLFLNDGIVVTPGEGFGEAGKGYVRLSVFGIVGRERQAVERLLSALGKC